MVQVFEKYDKELYAIWSKQDGTKWKYGFKNNYPNHIYFLLIKNGVVVAKCEILPSSGYNPDCIGLAYVDVHRDHFGNKYGTELLEFVFSWVAQQGRWSKISVSKYSILGFFFLKPTLDKIKENYPLKWECYNDQRAGYPYEDKNGKHHWPENVEELKNIICEFG